MTKQEEKKILEQIEKLIESAGQDSYIRLTFAGVPEVCKRNIEDDFANCPVADLEEERKRNAEQCRKNEAEVAGRLRKLEHENNALEENLRKTADQLEQYKAIVHGQSEKITQLSEELCTAAETLEARTKLLDEKNAEILALKAKLYDYMTKGAN